MQIWLKFHFHLKTLGILIKNNALILPPLPLIICGTALMILISERSDVFDLSNWLMFKGKRQNIKGTCQLSLARLFAQNTTGLVFIFKYPEPL